MGLPILLTHRATEWKKIRRKAGKERGPANAHVIARA